MRKLLSLSGVIVVSFGLAGCGGGGSVEEQSMTFADQIQAGAAMDDRLAVLPYSDLSGLPTSGSVRYNGYIAADLLYAGGLSNSVSGTLVIDANFADDSISGQAKDFVDLTEAVYSGTLTLSGGTIDRTVDPNLFYSISAGIGGVLTGGDQTAFTVDGTIDGDFVGSQHGGFYGDVSGTVDSINGLATVNGVAVAEQ